MRAVAFLQALRQRWQQALLKTLLALLVPVTLLALISLDDAPDSGIEGFLAWQDALPVNASWRYAMGFEAPADRDPLALGRHRILAYEAALAADPDPDNGSPLVDPYEFEKYDIPDHPLFCKLQEKGCLAALQSAGREGATLLRRHALLLERYRTWVELPVGRAESAIANAPQGPVLPTRALLRGNRLHSLAALQVARQGDARRALDMLYPHLARLRQYMVETDDLIGKVIGQMQAAETLQVIAVIGARTPGLRLAPVPPLTSRERELTRPFAREYRIVESELRYYQRHPETLMELGPVSGLLMPFYFKPQMTLNAVYRTLGESASASLQGPEAFARLAPTWTPPPLPDGFRLRNRLGADWLDRRDYSYLSVLGRLHDLDARIALFNAVAQRPGAAVDWTRVKNPYYPDAHPPVLSADGKAVCLAGPLPDPFRVRCLGL